MQAINQIQKIDEDMMISVLDNIYDKCISGIPKVSKSVEEMAADYLRKYQTREEACKAMLKNQVIKCTTSGIMTSFGGVITIPISLPANIGSVLYMQMRMIACAAYIMDYELDSDQTQTIIYACLAGVAINNVIKKSFVLFGKKFANGLIKKIPGRTITKINQKVGFRFITKFGEHGIINLGKMVPLVGASIGGLTDFSETKIIATRTYRWFVEGDYSVNG